MSSGEFFGLNTLLLFTSISLTSIPVYQFTFDQFTSIPFTQHYALITKFIYNLQLFIYNYFCIFISKLKSNERYQIVFTRKQT